MFANWYVYLLVSLELLLNSARSEGAPLQLTAFCVQPESVDSDWEWMESDLNRKHKSTTDLLTLILDTFQKRTMHHFK